VAPRIFKNSPRNPCPSPSPEVSTPMAVATQAPAIATPAFSAQSPRPRLLERLHNELRLRHCSPRTEKAYLGWVKRFVRYFGNVHPQQMGAHEVRQHLSHLASDLSVSASTQQQALCALVFLHDAVLGCPLQTFEPPIRAHRPMHVPVVLTPSEIERLFVELHEPSPTDGAAPLRLGTSSPRVPNTAREGS
jgi:hypothetical protein